MMKAKEAQEARFGTKNVDLDGAVEATLEDLRSINPWKLWMNAQKYLFKVVVLLSGADVVNTFQNLPLFSKTEEYLKVE